ncbi:MAG: helix-turn-helix transcriptional regulator [Paludibacteraceae bacterium]
MDTKITERDRIQQLMETEGLNSVQFANETGIKSATLSHILNGRNNPSLDVLKRILDRFRTVSSDWLFLGVGQMYRQKSQPQALSLFDITDETNSKTDDYTLKSIKNLVSDTEIIQKNIAPEPEKKNEPIKIISENVKSINKIIVYFSDNTFQEFHS